MRLTKLLDKIEYEITAGEFIDADILSVCRDSRLAISGSIFICIKGAAFDGHDFAMSAYSKGCRIFLVESDIKLPENALILKVNDTRKALALISAEFYGNPNDELTLIGITGTKGKTSTALTIYSILNGYGMKAGYIGSNGVKFGSYAYTTANTTPESCEIQKYMRLMANDGVKYLVLEVSSQALYMERVCNLKFDTLVYTNLYIDHIGGNEHPTFEHYRDCKRKLFSDFDSNNIIYNMDDAHANYMIENAKTKSITSCSSCGNKEADFYAENIEKVRNDEDLLTAFELNYKDEYFRTYIKMPGKFSVENSLLALAVCKICAGVPLNIGCKILKNVSIEGRFESVLSYGGALFIVDYAHNGASLKAALSAIRDFEPKRLICLFGSVGGRTFGRRKELGDVAAQMCDFCILSSDNPDSEDPMNVINDIARSFEKQGACKYIKIPDRKEAIKYAFENAESGDIILLAGKGHEDYQLICGKKFPFSEKAILSELASKVSFTK